MAKRTAKQSTRTTAKGRVPRKSSAKTTAGEQRSGSNGELVENRSPRGRRREGQPAEVKGTPAGLFGEHLERLMIAAGLNPGELAERMGIHPDVVRKYIRGVVTPNFKTLPEIAIALGLPDVRDLIPSIPTR